MNSFSHGYRDTGYPQAHFFKPFLSRPVPKIYDERHLVDTQFLSNFHDTVSTGEIFVILKFKSRLKKKP